MLKNYFLIDEVARNIEEVNIHMLSASDKRHPLAPLFHFPKFFNIENNLQVIYSMLHDVTHKLNHIFDEYPSISYLLTER